MFFLVPADEEPEGLSQGLPPEDGPAADVSADEPASERARAKVELDVDDAPFLEIEPEPEPEPEKKEPEPEPEKKAPAPEKPSLMARLKANKKKLILAAGALVLLVVVAVVLNIFVFGKKDVEPETVTVVVPEQEPEEPAGPAFTVSWEPFWVELHGAEGELRFLVCQFSIPFENSALRAEIANKELSLRDAVFYYLKNRPLILLTSEETSKAFKEDVVSIINEQLQAEKITEIYLEEYRILGP